MATVNEVSIPRIRRRAELDRLPYFAKDEDGNNVLRPDVGLPPIIDIHAHIGWSYGFNKPVDMRLTCPVRFFYNYDFDQDLMNDDTLHPTPEETARITRESQYALFRVGASTKTHTVANLAAEMDRMNYERCCLLPIEIPFSRAHSTQIANAAKLDKRLCAFAAVHPWPWTVAKERRLEQLVADGAPALKFHPEFQFIAPDNPHAMRMFAWCEAHGLPVLAHVGYKGVEPAWLRRKSEPERFRPVLRAFPKLKLLLAHTGITRYEATLAVAREFDEQVWLDISGQNVPISQYILSQYSHDRVLYGSDWPFYPLDVMIARVLVATEGNESLRHKMFRSNAVEFLKRPI